MTLEKGLGTRRAPSTDNLPSCDIPPRSARPHFPGKAGNDYEEKLATQSTLNKVPSRYAAVTVAVIDKHLFTRESITRSLKDLCDLLDVLSFVTCEECLESTKNYDVILYHAHESLANSHNKCEELTSIKGLLAIAPVIILCDVDSYDSICAAFDSGVRGYIPTVSTNLDLAIEIIYLVKVGGTFVPPCSLAARSIKASRTPKPITLQQFTPRQIDVLDCLKLGKSNKIIAYELKMSESSVKSHVRNIMRKMNATNRVEVACRAHDLICIDRA